MTKSEDVVIPRIHSNLDVPRHSKDASVRQACFICGKSVDATGRYDREHVIPRSLFKPSVLDEPLILTAHSSCNRAKAHDEEYAVSILQASAPDSSTFGNQGFTRTVENAKKRLGKVLHADGKPRNQPGAGLLVKMSQQVQGVNMFSKSGVFLGEYGKLPLDSPRLKNFYLNIAKGYYAAALGHSVDWDDYNIKVLHEMHPYDTAIPDSAFKFPFDHPTHLDSWGKDMFIGGRVDNNADGKPYSSWSVAIFNEHKGAVLFTHKSILIPPSKES